MIYSMTAFAAVTKQTSFARFNLEMRAVNHRYLELHFRLPEQFGDLENIFREKIKRNLERGKIECHLRLQWHNAEAGELPIDHKLLAELIKSCEKISEKLENPASISPLKLLSWPGVLTPSSQEQTQVQQDLLAAFDEVLEKFIEVRAKEGEAIKNLLLQRIDKMCVIVQEIHAYLPELLSQQQQRLHKRFEDAQVNLEPERLAQEMVLFAQRFDVAEELDRLDTHLNAVRDLLNQGGRLGRRLDFFMQELNREANTLGSKSFSTKLTQHAVELKVFIEQLREQIQNLE